MFPLMVRFCSRVTEPSHHRSTENKALSVICLFYLLSIRPGYLSIHSICLPIHLAYPSVLYPVCLSIHPFSLSTQSILSIRPFYLSIHSIFVSCLSIRLFYLQSVYHPAYVSTHPSIHPVCLAIHPVCVSIHLSIQSVSLSIFHVYNLSSICIYVCAQSCLTHFNHVNYSPPGSSVHGISQARILEWIAMPSSRGSSRCKDQACVSCVYCIKSEFLPH